MPTKITTVGKKKCRPFLLEVAVISPEEDFKFSLSVEKQCSPTLDPIWKLVFDLFKKNSTGAFVQIVHVSFTAETEGQAEGIEKTANNGVNKKQTDAAIKEVHPPSKKIGEGTGTPADEKKVMAGMGKIAMLAN